jgi:hypothetical protein
LFCLRHNTRYYLFILIIIKKYNLVKKNDEDDEPLNVPIAIAKTLENGLLSVDW